MEAEKALRILTINTQSKKNQASQRIDADYAETDINKIDKTLTKINNTWKIDYAEKPKIRSSEKTKLEKLFDDYLENKTDNFNSHYLKLLAFSYPQMYCLPQKKSDEKLSLLQSKNGFQIRKVLKLFSKHKKSRRFFLDGLVISYLDNYDESTKKFRDNFLSFLKRLNYCKNVKYLFRPGDLALMLQLSPKKYYIDKILDLGLRGSVINTKYFIKIKNDYEFK